jgi:methyl-accepting chemotaxis protein
VPKKVYKKLRLALRNFFFSSINRKLLFTFLVVAIIPLITSGFFSFYSSSNILLDKTLSELEVDVDQHVNKINQVLSGLEREVLFLGGVPPIQGIIRANKNNGIDTEGVSTYEQWTSRLGTIFMEIASSNKAYMQIRYLDENGNELVRVDSRDGAAEIISIENLQNKANRYYFKDTMKLDRGNIFVSPLDLNREGILAEIESPFKPTIRYATPIFDNSGNRKGVVITNINADSFLNEFKHSYKENDIDYDNVGKFIVDERGFYIAHPQKDKEWGNEGDLNTGHNISNNLQSGMADIILSGGADSVDMPKHNHAIAYKQVFPSSFSDESFFVIFEIIPREVILAPVTNLRNTLILISFGSLFLIIIFAYFISRKISGPIEKLYEGTKILEKGDLDYRVNIDSVDEIGKLGDSFNNMAASIKDSRGNIEKKVNDQTDNITDQKGKLETQQMAILNILEDIKDEKDKADLEEEKVSSILHNIGDGVFVVDRNRNIIVFNSQAEKISGFKRGEVIGKPYNKILKFIDEKDPTKINTEFIEDVMSTGTNQKMPSNTMLIQRDGRKIPVADSAAPLKDKNGNVTGCIVVFRDITKEREIDRAKSEFISVASHQLRTPMTGIQWVIERFLKKEIGLSDQGKEYLKDLHTSSVRLSELVDSLLNVSRIESGGGVAVTPEKLDLIKFIEDYLGELTPLLVKKNITLKFEDHPDNFEIKSDPKVLRNVIQSIVSNAIEYTPESGSIEVCVEKNSDVMIKVKDTGIGIPEKEQSRMFEKFHRADNAKVVKTDGTGLGLYIAKSATEALGGKIDFISHEGKGTTFYIELPIEIKKSEGGKDLL